MNKIHRDGVDIKVALASGMKRLPVGSDPLRPCDGSGLGRISSVPGVVEAVNGTARTAWADRWKRMLRGAIRPVYRTLKPLVRPLAFRVRRYFVEDVHQDLLNELRLNSHANQSETRQLIAELRHEVVSLFARQALETNERFRKILEEVHWPGTGDLASRQENERAIQAHCLGFVRTEPVQFPRRADRFHIQSLWEEIDSRWEEWKKCNVIYVAAVMYEGARILFQHAEVVSVETVSDIINHSMKSIGHRCSDIGIVSPGIAEDMCEHGGVLSLLARQCDGRLLILSNQSLIKAHSVLRYALHKHGFYEVAVITGDIAAGETLDHSSVGLWPDGESDFRSDSLGVQGGKEKVFTLVAGRTEVTSGRHLKWRASVGGSLSVTADGWCSLVDPGLNLSTLTLAEDPRRIGSYIESDIRWEQLGDGHLSLVSCYQGPGDMNMYAALISADGESGISVALWRHAGDWEKVDSVSYDAAKTGGFYRIAFSLITTLTSITIKVDGVTVLTVADHILPRVPVVGIRVSGSTFAFSNVNAGLERQ